MSPTTQERQPKICLDILIGDNFVIWYEKVKDYIYAWDHPRAAEFIDFAEWTPPADNPQQADPANYDYQQHNNADARKLRTVHNNTYSAIRGHLSTGIYQTTITLGRNVPKLLRHLRNRWNDGSVIDRNRLRDEYYALKLENFDTLEMYNSAFTNTLNVL